MIVLYHVLKIWMELIKQRNDNAGEKFYLVQTFSKVPNLVEISKKLKNLETFQIFVEGDAPALRVIRASTRLTVHRLQARTRTGTHQVIWIAWW